MGPAVEADGPLEAELRRGESRQRPYRRQRPSTPVEPLSHYLLTAVAVVVAVAAVAFLLSQIGQLGRQPPAQPAPTAIPAGQPPGGVVPPTAPTAPKAGQGVVRVTSRALEATYTVRSGDTLGSISNRFGVSLEALQSINNLADRDALSVGQKLVIPNQE